MPEPVNLDELDRNLAGIAAVMQPHSNAAGSWLAKSDHEQLNWLLLGPYSAVRKARDVLGEISLDSFPGENPPRAHRLAEAIVAIVNMTPAIAAELRRLRETIAHAHSCLEAGAVRAATLLLAPDPPTDTEKPHA